MILYIRVVKKQSKIPHTEGIINAAAVHFLLPVSALMVFMVVAHGKCSTEKIITFNAVRNVQLFETRISEI